MAMQQMSIPPSLDLLQTARTPAQLTPSPKCSPGDVWLNAPAALPPTWVPWPFSLSKQSTKATYCTI